METPQHDIDIPQEQEKKKRSPWLVVLIILLIMMMCCCITGAILCRGGAMLPDFLERYLRDVPGLENANEIWGLVEDIINDPDFDPGNFDPEDFLPEDFLEEEFDEFGNDQNLCSGLTGNLEMQVWVGPAAVVDLEPFGIGSVPFQVDYDQGSYLVQGEGRIDYEDELVKEWGTYTVFFNLLGVIDGFCIQNDDGAVLEITFDMTGYQEFVVDTDGQQEVFPKDLDYEFDYSFPVVEGSTESGEGWVLILHLD